MGTHCSKQCATPSARPRGQHAWPNPQAGCLEESETGGPWRKKSREEGTCGSSCLTHLRLKPGEWEVDIPTLYTKDSSLEP